MGIKTYYLRKGGEKFYPYAHASATFDSKGVKVEKRLDDLESEKADKLETDNKINTAKQEAIDTATAAMEELVGSGYDEISEEFIRGLFRKT